MFLADVDSPRWMVKWTIVHVQRTGPRLPSLPPSLSHIATTAEATTVRRRRRGGTASSWRWSQLGGVSGRLPVTSDEAAGDRGGAVACHGSARATWRRRQICHHEERINFVDGSSGWTRIPSLDHLQWVPMIQSGEVGFEATLELRASLLLLPGAQDWCSTQLLVYISPFNWLLIWLWCAAEQWSRLPFSGERRSTWSFCSPKAWRKKMQTWVQSSLCRIQAWRWRSQPVVGVRTWPLQGR